MQHRLPAPAAAGCPHWSQRAVLPRHASRWRVWRQRARDCGRCSRPLKPRSSAEQVSTRRCGRVWTPREAAAPGRPCPTPCHVAHAEHVVSHATWHTQSTWSASQVWPACTSLPCIHLNRASASGATRGGERAQGQSRGSETGFTRLPGRNEMAGRTSVPPNHRGPREDIRKHASPTN